MDTLRRCERCKAEAITVALSFARIFVCVRCEVARCRPQDSEQVRAELAALGGADRFSRWLARGQHLRPIDRTLALFVRDGDKLADLYRPTRSLKRAA